jgi:hypothetical protein
LNEIENASSQVKIAGARYTEAMERSTDLRIEKVNYTRASGNIARHVTTYCFKNDVNLTLFVRSKSIEEQDTNRAHHRRRCYELQRVSGSNQDKILSHESGG